MYTLAVDKMSSFIHSFIHSTTMSQLLLYARCLLATGRTTANTTDTVLVTLEHVVLLEGGGWGVGVGNGREKTEQNSVHLWRSISPY